MKRRRVVVLAAAFCLGACGGLPVGTGSTPSPEETPSEAGTPIPTSRPKPTVNTTGSPEPEMEIMGIEDVPSKALEPVQAAVDDLLARLSLAPTSTIAVRRVEPREWADASLGCPRPGMVYAQVITPGYLVVLEVDGADYELHTDAGHRVVLCEEPAVLGTPIEAAAKGSSTSQPQ